MVEEFLKTAVASVIASFFLGHAGGALAGVASSGGGLALADAMNPWFLQNTPVIHYCLAIDATQFHLGAEAADAHIHAAYAYWQKQFSTAEFEPIFPVLDKQNGPKVGTQTLLQVDCTEDPDVVFRFGSLDAERKAMVPDFDLTIAQTIRTSYDREKLRAKGFIYVSGDYGPGAKPDIASGLRRWSMADGALFQAVIAHELGHIFGLPDTGVVLWSIMSYTFVQTTLDVGKLFQSDPDVLRGMALPEVFTLSDAQWSLGSPTLSAHSLKVARALGLDRTSAAGCVKISLHGSTLAISASKAPMTMRGCTDTKLVGTARVELKKINERRESIVGLWLPPNQKVFVTSTDESIGYANFQTLVNRHPSAGSGLYTTATGQASVPVAFEWQPGGEHELPRISALIDGELVPDLIRSLYPYFETLPK